MRTPSDRKGWETLLESPEPPDQQKYAKEYDYQRSLQLGRYKTIGPGVKDEGMRLGACLARAGAHAGLEKTNSDGLDVPLTLPARERSSRWFCCSFKNLKVRFHAVVQDWLFLALLGVIMSILSFVMDYAIVSLQNGQMRLYYLVTPNLPLSALVWIGYVVILTMGSALFAHYMAPQAIGSGIPEMKTILRGVILKEYLSLRTLISKMVGLTLSLGSGLPMGKEGPFVHIASAVASQLSRLVHGSRAVFENESRSEEMLSAGCAVGVACTFSAPIGGVLFSIEVTSVYFAVRNYWRGFFAAICAATLFRVLRMLADSNTTRDVTMAAHFQTDFPWANAYMVQEFPFFAFIGVVGGFFGAFFVFVHRSTVLFLRRNLTAKALFQKFWPIYPLFVSFFISSVTFPMGLGKFIGGEGRFSHSMQEFFSNCTWTADWTHVSACLVPPSFNETVKVGAPDLHHWQGPDLLYDPMLTLAAFQIVYFFLSILASTLPVPSGIFMPVFVLGAAFGRLLGETVFNLFPDGFSQESTSFIRPGAYAVVGAAAFCGAVTHTVSIAVIVFELTGQLCLLLPVMIAVLISNAIASCLQPSIYDSIIRIKNLPYLPDIPHTSSLYHKIVVNQFMIRPVIFVSRNSTLEEVQIALETSTKIRALPLVENRDSMALIGSISRVQLQKLIETKIGTKARLAEAARRVKRTVDENLGPKIGGDEAEQRLEAGKSKDLSLSMTNSSATISFASNILKNMKPSIEIEDSTQDEPRKSNRFLVVPVTVVDDSGCEVEVPENGANESCNSNRLLVPGLRLPVLAQTKSESNFDRPSDGLQISRHAFHESSHHDVYNTIGSIVRSLATFGRNRKYARNDFELYGEERAQWEQSVLNEPIDFSMLTIDSTPFHLVDHTSLFKTHSLFSLLGLNRAYVTQNGRLVGVVALKELRLAIEMIQSGRVPLNGENFFDDPSIVRMEMEREEAGEENLESSNDGYLQLTPEHFQSSDNIEEAPNLSLDISVTSEASTELTFPSPSSSLEKEPPKTILVKSRPKSAHEDGVLLAVQPLVRGSSSMDDLIPSAGNKKKNSRHVKIVIPDDEKLPS